MPINPLSSGQFGVASTAPANPFQQDVTVTFPSAVSLPETSDSVTQSFTLGALFPLSHGWNSELDYTWSRNMLETAIPTVDADALSAALNSGALNPFVDTLAHPLALTPFVASETYSGQSTLNDIGLRMSGPVGALPGGIPTLTIGLEHRKEGTGEAPYSTSYPLTPSNNLVVDYFGHSQSTDSVYAEARIPLVSPQNGVSGVKALELQIAGRSEHYTVFNGTDYAYLSPSYLVPSNPPQGVRVVTQYTSTNPTLGLKYQPLQEWTLRASYATAFLPPTAAQLLSNPTPICGYACIPIFDPEKNQTYAVDFTSGGNSALQPQKSRDWDFGAIWEPDGFLRGLRLDTEYYAITQPNYIVAPTIQQVVSNPAFSSRVTRDPSTGLITLVDTGFLNATEYKTAGWDFTADYTKQTALGLFGLHATATVIKYDLRQYAISAPFEDYAGYPNDGGEGKLKANATFSWAYRGWSAAWSSVYYSSYYQQYAPGSPSLVLFPGVTPLQLLAQGGNSIPSQMYHDLFVSYSFAGTPGDAAGRIVKDLTIQLGIKNVFNKPPPFDAADVPYYYSYYGDPRLREYRVSVKKAF